MFDTVEDVISILICKTKERQNLTKIIIVNTKHVHVHVMHSLVHKFLIIIHQMGIGIVA